MCQNVDMTAIAVARQNAQRAASLNAIGYTWERVADICGYRSKQAAAQAVKRLNCRVPVASLEALRRAEDEELRLRRVMFHEELTDAKLQRDVDTMAILNRELDRIAHGVPGCSASTCRPVPRSGSRRR